MHEITSPGIETLRTFRRRLVKWTIISTVLVAVVFGYMRAVDAFQARVSAAHVEMRV